MILTVVARSISTVRYTKNVMDLFNGNFYKFFFSFVAVIVSTLAIILVVGGTQ